jgi:hypothetical protein
MRSAYPAVFIFSIACASAPAGSTARLSTTGPASPAPSIPVSNNSSPVRGSFLTGSFQTEYFAGETLYDALRRRAPTYLRSRPNPAAEMRNAVDPIAVYIDGMYSGDLDVLQLIPAHEVATVNRMSAPDATIRFGPRRNSGALLVTLVKHD